MRRDLRALRDYPAQWSIYHRPDVPPDGFPDSWIVSFVVTYQFRDSQRIQWRLGAPIRVDHHFPQNALSPPTFRVYWSNREPPLSRTTVAAVVFRLWKSATPPSAHPLPPAVLDGKWCWDPRKGALTAIILLPVGSPLSMATGTRSLPNVIRWARDFDARANKEDHLEIQDFGPLLDIAFGVLRPWTIIGATRRNLPHRTLVPSGK